MEKPVGLERLAAGEVELVHGRRTIVTALPLKRAARERLSRLLDARVLDVRDPCEAPDMVLTPACSPQLVGGLKRKYHGAPIVVVELEDWDLDIDLGGPVKRLLRSGADAYLVADSIDELAARLDTPTDAATGAAWSDPDEAARELPSTSAVDDLIAAFLRAPAEQHEPSERSGDG